MERAVPTQQYTQQPVIAYPQPQINRTPTTPVPIVQPIIVPYAVQYPQPVNTQPTIIRQNKEDVRKSVAMVSMKQRTEQAYCIFLPRDSMFVLRKQKNQIMSSM